MSAAWQIPAIESGGELARINHRGADLADDDAGSDISEARRIGQADADRERRGDRRHDSVAGAGNIEDLADFGALNMGRAVGRNQHRPFRAERGENRVEAATLDQRAEAAMISSSVATGIPVAWASSRRFGFTRSAPRYRM